jgi:hypothetical protein
MSASTTDDTEDVAMMWGRGGKVEGIHSPAFLAQDKIEMDLSTGNVSSKVHVHDHPNE